MSHRLQQRLCQSTHHLNPFRMDLSTLSSRTSPFLIKLVSGIFQTVVVALFYSVPVGLHRICSAEYPRYSEWDGPI